MVLYKVTFVCFGVMMMCQFLTTAEAGQDERTRLIIMGTSELHADILSWDYTRDTGEGVYGSLSRVATLVDSIRSEHKYTLLLDSGDFLQGNPLADYFAKHDTLERQFPLLQVADMMRFDAMAIGNHEFDYGLDYFNRQVEQTKTPLLGANILKYGTSEPAYKPYIMMEKAGLNIAVIGLCTPGEMVWNRPIHEGNLTFADGTEITKKYAAHVIEEENADIIIVAAHAAFYGPDSYTHEDVPEENFGMSILAEVPEVDAMVLGHRPHAFQLVEQWPDSEPVAVIAAGGRGSHLGVIELEIDQSGDNARVTFAKTHMIETAHAAEHPDVLELMQDTHAEVREFVNQTLTYTDDIWSGEHARIQNTGAVDLIHAVQLKQTGADISIAAAFNTSFSFGPGPIRHRDIYELYRYENTLYKIEMTGKQVRDYLEHTSQYYLQSIREGELRINPTWMGFDYDMFSGIEYTLDLRNEPGERVTRLRRNGDNVNDDDIFTVAINSYRAEGSGHFDMIRDAEVLMIIDVSVRDLIIEYLKNLDQINIEDIKQNNWNLIY